MEGVDAYLSTCTPFNVRTTRECVCISWLASDIEIYTDIDGFGFSDSS